ncbi:MAG: lytic transglycosylase domain-containing protein [Actinomycetota bacterium]|nr:lytic transglycosylase domain-containing protein [Actinomycetota bacterium]
MRTTHRLRSIAILGLVLVLAVGAVMLGISTAKRYGLMGPVQVPSEYRALVLSAAERCPRIPAEVFAAQIAAESSWNARATSPAGARGIAQFMPAVWEQYGLDANGDGQISVWDPEDAIPSAAELNCKNRQLTKGVPGNRLANTLAAYNAGYSAVRRYEGVPPFPETQAYVRKILENAKSINW